MDWMNFLEQIFELIVYPVLSIVGAYIVCLIQTKINELKKKSDNETAEKYLNMLDNTIHTAVLATTQTYVECLKAQGTFDAEAQKTALKLTYDAVTRVLTDEAMKYLAVYIGDMEAYILNKIEADIKLCK